MTPEEWQRMMGVRRTNGAGAFVQPANTGNNAAGTGATAAVPTQSVRTPYDNTQANFSTGQEQNADSGAVVQAVNPIENVPQSDTRPAQTKQEAVAGAMNVPQATTNKPSVTPAGNAAVTVTTPPQAAVNNGLDARARQFEASRGKAVTDQVQAAKEAEAMATVMNDPELRTMFDKGGHYADEAIKLAAILNAKGGLKERMNIIKPKLETPEDTAAREKREKRDRRLAGLAQMIGALGVLGNAATSRYGRAVKLADMSGAVGKQQTAAQADREKILKQYSDYEKQHSELINKANEAAYKREKSDKDEQYRQDQLALQNRRAEETEKYNAKNTRLKEEKQQADQKIAERNQQLAEQKEKNRHDESVANEAGRTLRAEKAEEGRTQRSANKGGKNGSGNSSGNARSTSRSNRGGKNNKNRDF